MSAPTSFLLIMSYAMHVISIPALLELEELHPHQVLVEKALVEEWTEALHGRVIFVSHEWLSWDHADPSGEQLRALQRLLRRLLNGEISSVESHWQQKVVFHQNTVVTAKEWMAALPHMYIWLDFMSIPQLGARGTVTDTADMAEASGLTESQQKTAQDLRNAVDSIPAYVERATLLLVLVPVAFHINRREPCNLCTWRRRGWCRLELQAALLKCGMLQVMVCIGAEAAPYFLLPVDAYKLSCGTGDFTCCQRNHVLNGQAILCDKYKVYRPLAAVGQGGREGGNVIKDH